MDLTPVADVETFRAEVVHFLDAELPRDWPGFGALSREQRSEFATLWRTRLLERGFLAVTWPAEYGGAGRTPLEQSVLGEEFARRGVPTHPHPNDGLSFGTVGPTILAFGDEGQKQEHLPRIISGERRWAQGYSEPEAGSDLFALRTRAVLRGDQWIINGQKVWQSEYAEANWILLLVRTEEEPGARGVSVLLVGLDQPGVEVRPIRTMTGREELCEIFFTDASADAGSLLGKRGEGARVAMALLGFERGSAVSAHAACLVEFRRLVDLVVVAGLQDDAEVRMRVAQCFSDLQVLRHLGLRNLSTMVAGQPPGAESSISKLRESEFRVKTAALAMEVLGAESSVRRGPAGIGYFTAEPRGAPNTPTMWIDQYLTARAASIYGGSAQIQRNILGERLLGLPREPAVSR